MNSVNANPEAAPVKSNFYPTFFLALFLGPFGAHRFYTGKIISGILQLVTFGGCGVWWLVDLLIVLLGKFKDKNNTAIRNVNPVLTWLIAGIPLALFGGFIFLGALAQAAAHGAFGKDMADSMAKSMAKTKADIVTKANAEKPGNEEKIGKSTTSVSPNYVGEYLCESPSGVVLNLKADNSSVTTIGDNTIEGHWSITGKTITVTSDEGGSSMTFRIQSDGLLVETKDGWTFKKPVSKYSHEEMVGVFKSSSSPSFTLHLNADGTLLMDYGENAKFTGKWERISTDGITTTYNEAPYNENPLFYTIVSKDKLKPLMDKEALKMNIKAPMFIRVK
jgi:TM2 domain-containing membrane protein YozV